MKKTLIIFSTTDGHTKFICEKIQRQLKNRDLVELISIDQHKNIRIEEYDTIIFGASIRSVSYTHLRAHET